MPSVRLRLHDGVMSAYFSAGSTAQAAEPAIFRTPLGTVMIEIQGVINLGDVPLLPTELDVSSADGRTIAEVPHTVIGELDTSHVAEPGHPVTLMVGDTQLLRGNVTKLPVPLAVLDVSDAGGDVGVVDIVTHKVLFNKRPEMRHLP